LLTVFGVLGTTTATDPRLPTPVERSFANGGVPATTADGLNQQQQPPGKADRRVTSVFTTSSAGMIVLRKRWRGRYACTSRCTSTGGTGLVRRPVLVHVLLHANLSRSERDGNRTGRGTEKDSQNQALENIAAGAPNSQRRRSTETVMGIAACLSRMNGNCHVRFG